MRTQAEMVDSIHATLRSRRMRERFFHLRLYEGEPAERSFLVGVELSEAAHAARRRAP
ncbi:MAG: hypothetical protein LC624_11385 [Halobacteriales archaeon]|nr:hypothetical protein [Halobacteriales archaeon]